MKYRFLSPAEKELMEGTLYYEKESPGLGLRFLDQVEATISLILRFPEAWRAISENHRMCRVKGFPYGLIFTKEPDGILITSVMHLSRDPESWKINIR